MAKKEGDWKSSLLDAFGGQVISGIKDKAHNAVVVTQKKITRKASGLLLMLLGLTFIVLGSLFYLIDVMGYTRSGAYLLAGAILILLSIILVQSSKLLKY